MAASTTGGRDKDSILAAAQQQVRADAAVLLSGIVYGRGAGRTKKAAEQEAAETAWRALSDGGPEA